MKSTCLNNRGQLVAIVRIVISPHMFAVSLPRPSVYFIHDKLMVCVQQLGGAVPRAKRPSRELIFAAGHLSPSYQQISSVCDSSSELLIQTDCLTTLALFAHRSCHVVVAHARWHCTGVTSNSVRSEMVSVCVLKKFVSQ